MKIKFELFAIKFLKVFITGINRVLSKCKMALVVQMRSVGWKRPSFVNGYDYIRFSSMELVAREIHERKIPGDVAELGVYRGDFASKNQHCVSGQKNFICLILSRDLPRRT